MELFNRNKTLIVHLKKWWKKHKEIKKGLKKWDLEKN
jgi:hypothetical protein